MKIKRVKKKSLEETKDLKRKRNERYYEKHKSDIALKKVQNKKTALSNNETTIEHEEKKSYQKFQVDKTLQKKEEYKNAKVINNENLSKINLDVRPDSNDLNKPQSIKRKSENNKFTINNKKNY